MAPILKRSELPQDVVRELRRCGQGNALFDRELIAYKRLCEEDETMDESYKVLLVSLFSQGQNIQEANRNVEQKAEEDKRVLRKRVSNESRTPASRIDIIEISSTEEEEEAPKRRNRKIFVKKSRNNKEDHKKVINKKSTSTSDADTDYYGYYDDDDESEDSDVDMMKPRKSLKGRRFAPPKSRDVGESSRVAITDCEVEYRRQVLEVMSKPFDMTDYTTLNNKLDDGLYAKLFPELGKELDKCRHNQRKRLALMRGFDFWIRDLAREGAFRPWRDEECLAVESAPPVTSPPPPPPPSSSNIVKILNNSD